MCFLAACAAPEQPPTAEQGTRCAVAPVVVTEKSAVDTDDPAIWINPDDPAKSLILGTDKGGSIFVFDLDGKIIPEKTVTGMGRMNNIDVAYGFPLGGETIDIAVATDRNEGTHPGLSSAGHDADRQRRHQDVRRRRGRSSADGSRDLHAAVGRRLLRHRQPQIRSLGRLSLAVPFSRTPVTEPSRPPRCGSSGLQRRICRG